MGAYAYGAAGSLAVVGLCGLKMSLYLNKSQDTARYSFYELWVTRGFGIKYELYNFQVKMLM